MSIRYVNAALGSVLATLILVTIAFGQEPGRTPNPARAAQMEAEARAHPILAIGSIAPEFNLPGADGRMHKLSDFAAYPAMVVLFNCVHCPMAQIYESRIQRLYDDYKNRGVGFVVINPNSEEALGPTGGGGYSDMSDSLEGIMIRVRYRHITYPYLYDGETQSVTRAYGPHATPHIFVFDKDRKLQYEGRIDDSPREPLAKSFDARNALEAVLAGKPAPVTHTASFGCSTKWINREAEAAVRAKILAEPVTLDMATADDLKKLRANQTDKTVVVYLGATWMQSPVDALPEIIETYHWFRGRKVDVVTVATDSPEDRAAVTKALQDAHAGTHNLLLASDQTSELLRAFDSTWETGVPFTVIIAPGGQVIYHETGEIHPEIWRSGAPFWRAGQTPPAIPAIPHTGRRSRNAAALHFREAAQKPGGPRATGRFKRRPTLPEYLAKAVPNPMTKRFLWYVNTAPSYLGIFLWIAFYRQLAAGTLAHAGLGLCLIGLVVAGVLCYALYYRVPAMLGMQTGYPLYVVGSSTFGTAGGYIMPGLLMGLLQCWFAVATYLASDFILQGLHVQSTPMTMPLIVTGILWGCAMAWVGTKGMQYLSKVALYLNAIPLIMLILVFSQTAGGSAATRFRPARRILTWPSLVCWRP